MIELRKLLSSYMWIEHIAKWEKVIKRLMTCRFIYPSYIHLLPLMGEVG